MSKKKRALESIKQIDQEAQEIIREAEETLKRIDMAEAWDNGFDEAWSIFIDDDGNLKPIEEIDIDAIHKNPYRKEQLGEY